MGVRRRVGGQGGWERRIEAFVKIQIFFGGWGFCTILGIIKIIKKGGSVGAGG